MKPPCREQLPLAPLLHAYTSAGVPSVAELHSVPALGSRFAAVLSATAHFLYDSFLDTASDDDLRDALGRFHEAVVRPPLHPDVPRRRAGFLRHALGYLLRGQDSPPAKLEAVVSPSGPYHVPGLGPSFWSAVLQGACPARHPGWTPATLAGAARLGLLRAQPAAGALRTYSSLIEAHEKLRGLCPELTSLHIDHFLSLVAYMPGRTLSEGTAWLDRCPIKDVVRQVRARTPVRQRLKERGLALASAQEKLEAGLAARDGKLIGDALAEADPAGAGRCPLDWGLYGEALTLWVGRLWEADDPDPVLQSFWGADELPGAGSWLPAAVLHLRDPQRWAPWDEDSRRGWEALDESASWAGAPVERYRLYNAAVSWLRERHGLHPLEVPAVLAGLVQERPEEGGEKPSSFGGFCADTFTFLAELAANNRRTWMERQRDRYAFTVRRPLTELCVALSERYVEPVLRRGHGWNLVTDARSGRALTSVCKNAYGKSDPYTPTLWITFCPPGTRQAVPQLFVRLDSQGLGAGLRLGPQARPAREALRHNLQRYHARVARLLQERGALEGCAFGLADSAGERISSEHALLHWAGGRSQEAGVRLEPDDPRLGNEDLVGAVLLTFDQLLPLFACCVEADAGATLAKLGGGGEEAGEEGAFTEGDFQHLTFLDGAWVRQVRGLLSLKKQLILQGVPGTGKTHVAKALARLLTGGKDDAFRLVQFHPAYSYEEFVEGIKVRSVAVDGRHDVTYPVEEGLLCSFAALAASRPEQPHVLLIDEINRGNLPRIFGELLYLLEYREQALDLPYSRRPFRLPANLYVLATMNAADRSVAPVDQALRRRFSFVEMEPDANVLAGWLRRHPPAAGPAFAERVLQLFDRLNQKLRGELGWHAQVGQSYFMVPELDEERLGMVWRHHVRPLLDEHFFGQPGRAAGYDVLLNGGGTRPAGRRQPSEV